MSSLNFSNINQNGSSQNDRMTQIQNNSNQYMNGRVMVSGRVPAPFELFQGENKEQTKAYQHTTLENALETTPVSDMFFSQANKNYIHQRIINDVYEKSNNQYSISRQSDIHLLIIMRSIYLQYSRNLFCNIKEQVNNLNEMVIKDCVSRIISEVKQRQKYNDFVSYLPEQMPLPKNPSTKGDKILYSKIG